MTYKKMPIDGGGEAIQNDMWANSVEKKITFAGGTTNAWGDDGGTRDGAAIFEVSGTVLVKIVGICTVDLVGAATIEVGTSSSTANLLPQVANATTIDAGKIWHMTDGTVDSFAEASSVLIEKIITEDIDLTVGTTDITAGAINFICFWYPLSEGASVTASSY